MPIPQFPKKYDGEVIITPQQHFLAEKEEYTDLVVPKSVIICFESYIMDHYRNLEETTNKKFWTSEMIYLNDKEKDWAMVGNFGIGGPAASHILEILIAIGVEKFIVLGHAGGLQQDNKKGSIILIEQAIRDEGLSYHYLPPSKFAYASSELTQKIARQLKESDIHFVKGTSWTIDSMYRETKEEVEHYKSEGVDTVEMELASLFAVASFRQIKIAALMVVSDYVFTHQWEEHLNSENVKENLLQVLKIIQSF